MTGGRGGDTGWLVALCIARAGASVMSMAFPTVLAAVQTEWGLSNRAAGSISSASQAGTALSLVVLSAMADYWGPRAVFLVSSAVAAVVALAPAGARAGPGVRRPALLRDGGGGGGQLYAGGDVDRGPLRARDAGAARWAGSSRRPPSDTCWRSRPAAGWWPRPGGARRSGRWPWVRCSASSVSIGLFRDRRPSAAAVAAPRFSLDTGLARQPCGAVHRGRLRLPLLGAPGHVGLDARLHGGRARRPWSLAGALGGMGSGARRTLSRDGHRGGEHRRLALRSLGPHRGHRVDDGGEHAVLVHLRLDARDAVARGGAAGLPLRLCRARRFAGVLDRDHRDGAAGPAGLGAGHPLAAGLRRGGHLAVGIRLDARSARRARIIRGLGVGVLHAGQSAACSGSSPSSGCGACPRRVAWRGGRR